MFLCVRNARICSDGVITDGSVLVRDGDILAVARHLDAPEGARELDAKGLYLSSGFIDLHVHGGGGHAFFAGDEESVVAAANAHALHGTTTILPTTTAGSMAEITRAADAIERAMQSGRALPHIAGVHMEGPFLSGGQVGAQPPEGVYPPTRERVDALLAHAPHLRMMGVAPEVEGALEVGDRLASRGVVVSVAHSDATYARVQEAIQHGFSDVTHLYSACSTVRREGGFRIPGVVEAGLNLDALTVQVIADGCHLPPELLSLVYRCKGADGMYLITDGLEYAATDIAEGTEFIEHGARRVYEDGVVKMIDRRAFAGSVATTDRLVRVARGAGIPLAHAVRMVTENPARRIGLTRRGAVRPGYEADLVLFDEDIRVRLCMVGGKTIVNEV